LEEHFARHTGHTNIVFELKRIRFALSLKPTGICVGLEEFAGYYAFLFARDVVLFECPVYGNAAYVAKGDWRLLSQQFKGQLEQRGERIIHRRFWRADIRSALRR
jgi:hypothetical protein